MVCVFVLFGWLVVGASSLFYLFPTLDTVTCLREFEKGHFQITNTTCTVIALLAPTQHNTLKLKPWPLLLTTTHRLGFTLPFISHFVYYVNPTHNP